MTVVRWTTGPKADAAALQRARQLEARADFLDRYAARHRAFDCVEHYGYIARLLCDDAQRLRERAADIRRHG